MNKVLVSACFLGELVRYNGEIKELLHPLLQKWQGEKRLISFCPEVSGGLPTPRPPAEIQSSSGKVITSSGKNVSNAFLRGANNALSVCVEHDIKYALLKESSPSCGSNTIYDGSFTQTKVNGQGVTTRLLRENGIKVFSEINIEELADLLED